MSRIDEAMTYDHIQQVKEDFVSASVRAHQAERMRLSLEIIKAVREATDENFIITYRYGVNDITFKDDIIFAKALESAGVDLLDVSAGIKVSTILQGILQMMTLMD
ncbi:MAG: hypothetical protein B6I17_02050 [Tenericutes bacterium 4572_104]|nr:MAG: hypothetical protein B6I17_02050 [Tenericutes bacterium 4572_104]